MFDLRMMPGFPHSVINYGSGILRIKFINFIPAAMSGTAVKTYIYSALIYDTTTSGTSTSPIGPAVWPLFLLSLLILAGVFGKHRLDN